MEVRVPVIPGINDDLGKLNAWPDFPSVPSCTTSTHRGNLAEPEVHTKLLEDKQGLDRSAHLVRSYFKLHGHHIQFNVVPAGTLRAAQANPEKYRDFVVRVAGYSDYFCDLTEALQNEIIARTEQKAFERSPAPRV